MTGHEDLFADYRPLLFTIAYQILGSATDAEDALQEGFLRWMRVDPTHIDDPRAYLAQIVTRQSLNQLRAAKRRREEYVGSWLPEPIRTTSDLGQDVELAESVSVAMMLVLETLGPDERAVFVLHDVFGYGHREIAGMIDKSDAAVRQIARRARSHVHARRKRFETDRETGREIVPAFLSAARNGDIQALMDLMSPEVVEISDGGGKAQAALRPVLGHDRVAHLVVGIAQRHMADMRVELSTFNGLPAALFLSEDRIDSVLMFEIADDLVQAVYAIRNPDKLRTTTTIRPLTRTKDPT